MRVSMRARVGRPIWLQPHFRRLLLKPSKSLPEGRLQPNWPPYNMQTFGPACAKLKWMSAATFVAGIVLALSLGVFLAALCFRSRPPPPVMETLQRLEAQIKDLEAQRQHALGGLDQHLTSLSRETVALSQALRAPNSRGRWGELTLRRVAELSG